MSQSDFLIDNVSRSLFRTENNQALQALASLSSGATEPTTTYAYQLWADTTAGVVKQRNAANNAWNTLFSLTGGQLAALAGMNLAGGVNDKRSTVAATATTTPLWDAGTGNVQDWTGTPTITNFPAAPQAGARRTVYPAAGTIITDNANIDVEGDATYTVVAGDRIEIEALTTSTFKVWIKKKSGASNNIKPAFSVDKSTDQSMTSAVSAVVTWQTENFDTNANFASNRFTPTVSGYYQINSSIRSQATNMTASFISLYKNGSLHKNGSSIAGITTNAPITHHVSDLVYMNGSTDYLEVYGSVTGTTPIIQFAAAGANGFSGSLVKEA
jgi:hypothetical protein